MTVSRKPPDMPQEMWDKTLAGAVEKLHEEAEKLDQVLKNSWFWRFTLWLDKKLSRGKQ